MKSKTAKITLNIEAKGENLAKAREAARDKLAEIQAGKDPRKPAKPAAALPGTVSELCDRYVKDYLKGHVRRWEAAGGEIDRDIRPNLGALRLDEIERGHVRQMLAEIAPSKPVAANRALQRARAVFNWRMANDLAPSNPTLGVAKPTKERPVSRVLSDEELAAVWAACDTLNYPGREYVQLLILTGQRRDDVRLMHWGEIDLARSDWVIPRERYKGDRAHLVPLTNTLKGMLANMPFGSGYVFFPTGGKRAYGNVVKPKRRIDATAKIPAWTLHDLRRTMRTGLSRLGIRAEISERVIVTASVVGSASPTTRMTTAPKNWRLSKRGTRMSARSSKSAPIAMRSTLRSMQGKAREREIRLQPGTENRVAAAHRAGGQSFLGRGGGD